jgi:hypothetical protein
MGPVETAVEGLKEAVKAFAPGLTFKDILQDVGAELKQMGAHGAHELAAALFTGNSFVMYPRGHHDDPQHGLPPEANKEQDHGREM